MITIGELIPRMREFSDRRPKTVSPSEREPCRLFRADDLRERSIRAFCSSRKKEMHLERLLGILMAKNGGGYLRQVSEERGETQKNIPAAR
jgi:hypothetical protein